MKVETFCDELEKICEAAYESGVEMTDAEKLAARCLQAQLVIAKEIESLDLDSRMKKNGLKAVKATIYLDEVRKSEKKPSDTMLEQITNLNKMVSDASTLYETSEARLESLQRYLDIFKDLHIYFRGISKGMYA